MTAVTSDDILRFWFEDIDTKRWFIQDDAFDAELGERFGHVLEAARNGELDHWAGAPESSLALILVLDQFSRNLYRDSAKAFESDARAVQLALDGIGRDFDKSLSLAQRSFYYLPFRHAEDLAMQRLGLSKTRELNAAGYGSDKYALNHLELIERFGRFPHRNRVLGRANTPEEAAYLAEGNAGF